MEKPEDLIATLELGSLSPPTNRDSKLARIYAMPVAVRCEVLEEINRAELPTLRRVLIAAGSASITGLESYVRPLRWILGGPFSALWNMMAHKGREAIEELESQFFEEVISVSLRIVESDPPEIIEGLFARAALRRLLTNILSRPTEEIRIQFFDATKKVVQHPVVCAHLVYSLFEALREAVQTPDVSTAYYEGFTYSEKASVSFKIPGSSELGLKQESGYTWSPVPMLKALSKLNELRLTRMFSDYQRMLLYAASCEWNAPQKLIYDTELQKWINLEAGKFRVQTDYEYLTDPQEVVRILSAS